MKKKIYDYTNTEINKMKRQELLKLYYERNKDYFELLNGSNKNWSKEHTFERFCELKKAFTVAELKEILKWK